MIDLLARAPLYLARLDALASNAAAVELAAVALCTLGVWALLAVRS